MRPLFREEALRHQQIRWLGDILLTQPMATWVLTGLALALAGALLALLIFGSYTRHSTINGELRPDKGTLSIRAPQSGLVLRKLVQEGQPVRKGQALFILGSDRDASSQPAIQQAISEQIAKRRQSLETQRSRTQALQLQEQQRLQTQLSSLGNEMDKLKMAMSMQQERTRLAEGVVKRYESLVEQHFVSAEQLAQKQSELLDQRSRLQQLEKEQAGLQRQFADTERQLQQLPGQQQNQLSGLERELAELNQEWMESESRRTITLTAPEDGVATAVLAEQGQPVNPERPLMSLIPAHARLQARLYAPSQDIGFIRPGNRVVLRYAAYPFQKFGHQTGKVISVSRTSINLQESGVAAADTRSEPMYQITVQLAQQDFVSRGGHFPLQPGMRLQAEVQQERRKLYEWALEPLFGFSDRLQ
ncbi:HlyD family secretion protein [Leeia aquatica]|uniref:HlyD family efflux transporter periplasmic adaptor subunit n=1 Tax=Leeia aquatica TaxID=2725557 RepID=A0A847SJV0_9NEIS|nr:HlyD family efflux transporter periplasmic adaptor subunit [Leeia aquatica]NLR76192.1 HlyD family efflux transporter periplasmic adaptor subunit [Leeia aquatica]